VNESGSPNSIGTASTPAPHYRHVLLVEDEPRLRMIVRSNLEHRGVEVSEARDVAEALAEIEANPPDLVLLDINLPDRTGWDVLRDLRATGPLPPTVVVSAVRVAPDRLREFGVLAYLPKPFPIDALVRLVVEGVHP
jgi:DNA-binding response OmpR family regulator